LLLRLICYIKGYLRIRIAGYSTERFLNACRHRGIYLWGLQAVSGAYEMNISISGFRKLKPIIRKTGTKVTIIKRSGLPFYLFRYRKRKLFFAGSFCFVFLIFWMSHYIWNIDITGNSTRTDETLLEFLKTKSVHNGMAKKSVDCQRIVKDIRKEYDDIIWVSASIKGTRLIIQVKENEDSPAVSVNKTGNKNKKDMETVRQPVDIVADKDCTIVSAIVRNGLLNTKIGAKIKKGDVLVSGQIPVNNDAGEIIGYQYHISDADIIGKAVLNYEDSCLNTCIEKEEYEICKKEYSLKIGNMRFTYGGVKNNYDAFTMSGQQWQFKIFDNFFFPVYWTQREAIPYKPHEKQRQKEEIQQILTERFVRYCEDLEKKGVEIIENDVKIYTGTEESSARGSLTVTMPIGRKKASELLEIPEKKEDTEKETGERTNGNDGSSH
jgi:sporulation protein YqfD